MTKIPTYIDGIASSQAIDTAGEIVDLQGLDITSLVGAAFNFEHESKLPSQIVGKILEAKKIFSVDDCLNDRHTKYWLKCKTPFLYVMGRLFDDKKPSAVEVAALFMDDAVHPNEHPMVSFSIEGARLGEKNGMLVPRSIARKVTITGSAANKSCVAEMVPTKKESRDDMDSFFKGEMELFKFEPTYEEILEKAEKWSSKLHSTGINHSHSVHGTVGIKKMPIGGSHQFEVKHNDKLIGMSPNVKHANTAAKKYMGSLDKGETGHEKGVHVKHGNVHPSLGRSTAGSFAQATKGAATSEWKNTFTQKAAGEHKRILGEMKGMPNPKLTKAMEAGSSMAAPSELSQGAALGKESLERKMHKKERSNGYKEAENAYAGWEKREQFRTYMKKRMPHLADGEVDAIGRVLAFKQASDKKKKISSMYSGIAAKGQNQK